MSEDKHRARASSSPEDEDIDVTTDDDPPPSPHARRRRKGKLALRIPDDEIARPDPPKVEVKSEPPPPPKVESKSNGEAQIIKPTRIISVNPPPPEPEPEPSPESVEPDTQDEDDDDEEPLTPVLPPVRDLAKTDVQNDDEDIDVPVDEDEPEYRPRMPTFPSNPPPMPDADKARKLPSVPPPPKVPTVSSVPPPVPADALASTPQLEEEQPKQRPRAAALFDDEEVRGSRPDEQEAKKEPDKEADEEAEEIDPDRTSSPPTLESGDEIDTSDLMSVESRPPVSAPKPAPPLPQKLIPLVTPGAGIPSALAPPALTEGLVPRRRARPWWEELFNDDFIRTIPKFTDAQIADEADFIEDSLGVAKGGALLDLGCGTGRHAIELTRRGYSVVGFDLSLALLARAGEEAQERNQKLNFVQGDMREMTFDEAFDGVYCWGTTFGFFEEEKNTAVIGRVHKALRHGGQFLLDVVSRDFAIQQSPSLAWFEGEGCVCMDEMQVDWITSRMRVKRTMMLDDGRSKEIEYSIRIYSLHELGKMLHEGGFRVAEVSGRIQTPGVFFGPHSPRTLILAEKR